MRRGLSRIEVVVLLLVGVVLGGGALPVLQGTRCDDRLAVSMANLATLNLAHAAYAADWDDRQFTVTRDDLGAFGGDCAMYAAGTGAYHPPLPLGEDCGGDLRSIDYVEELQFPIVCNENFGFVKPFNFDGPAAGRGSFLVPNARGFHEYVNGRFFDPVFYAPRDEVVLDIVSPLLDVDCAYAADAVEPALYLSSSYCLSPAAMFDPTVMSAPVVPHPDGSFGWLDPDSFAEGYRSPTVSQAAYPSLKTRMLEHRQLQREPPFACNPAFEPGTFDGCEPYFFCHSVESSPVTLFYDGHVRSVGVDEFKRADRTHTFAEGYGLWHRGTPLGAAGYFGAEAWDFRAHYASFHILTIDGILGRDLLAE